MLIWVDVTAPSHVQVNDVAELLALHPLIAEDIAERNQRAKVAEVEGAIHIVMFWIAYEGEITETRDRHRAQPPVAAHGPRAGLGPVHAAASSAATPASLLRRGPDFLLYALTDGIVDAYFPVLDAIEDEIDALQDDVIAQAHHVDPGAAVRAQAPAHRPAPGDVARPARSSTSSPTGTSPWSKPEHVIYFRDVYDHLIRVTDELDNDRELVAGTLEVYLSTINNNLSTIMKRLTGVTVILAGIGAVAGLFGMSEAGRGARGRRGQPGSGW